MFKRSPATSPRHLSPNPSTSPSQPHLRSRSTSLPSSTTLTYSAPASRPVQSEEALKTVKVLEGVLVAWNEYRLAISQQGRAGRRLASAMRDLGGRMDKDGVGYNAVRPTAQTLDTVADLTMAHSKRLESTYDQANSEASRYFQNLARQVRDHEAYLANEGKRAMKSEKAYRKASKVMTEGALKGSGLEGMKDALVLEVEAASEYHANLLGDAQAAILSRISAGLAGIIHPTVAYHSEGLKVAAERLGEIEYFRALSAAQWHDLSLPEAYGVPPDATAPEPYVGCVGGTANASSKRDEAQSEEAVRAYIPPTDPRQPSVPIRPRLPLPYTSTQSATPPVMRSRNSLPPPPMYASSSSLTTLRQLSSPSAASSILPPRHYTQPLNLTPAVTSRRRVSDIAPLHPTSAAPALAQSLRRVSLPPQLTAPGGPRPRPSRVPTAPSLKPTSGIPSYSNFAPEDGVLASSTSSRQSSSILSSSLLSPGSNSHSSATAIDAGETGGLRSAMKKRPVSFSGGKEWDAGSFPWGMASDEAGEGWSGVGIEGAGGVLQPSPRRVPALSPELREMMSG